MPKALWKSYGVWELTLKNLPACSKLVHRGKVSGFEFRVLGFEFRVPGFGFLVPSFGLQVSVSGFWASGPKFRV